MSWIWNPKTKGSGIITCIPQEGRCPNNCDDCFFQSGRSYLEPLEENLPHVPAVPLTQGRVVRFNDGHDSNVDREAVEAIAETCEDYFFNTAIPKDLEEFSGPVVLTLNPGKMTDKEWHQLVDIPKNLMFVRFRTNAWNVDQLRAAIGYYTRQDVPVVITYMAYFTKAISADFLHEYEYKKRTINSYWCMTLEAQKNIEHKYYRNSLVYTCGYKGTHSCQRCGNCIREYYNTKERLRDGANI